MVCVASFHDHLKTEENVAAKFYEMRHPSRLSSSMVSQSDQISQCYHLTYD